MDKWDRSIALLIAAIVIFVVLYLVSQGYGCGLPECPRG